MAKVKVKLVEIGNMSNSIALMVDDNCSFIGLIAAMKKLSAAQQAKLLKFEESCKLGWHTAYGAPCRDCTIINHGLIVRDETQDETGRFCAGNRVYDLGASWCVYYLTNWQGDRDRLYIVGKGAAATADKAIAYADKPIWQGDKIY